MKSPLILGAIDAGSNAIRVSIAQANGPNDFSFLVNERVPVRLGHHAFTRHELDPETIESAVTAFAWFRQLFDQHGVQYYRATATSAVRNSRNRERLIHRLFHDANIELEVIDGKEEARLVRRAVLGAFKKTKPPKVIVDLGGGSLEITTRKHAVWEAASMHIGTVRLMESFGLTREISPDEAALLSRYVSSHLESSMPLRNLRENLWAAACGGNAEALASLFGDVDPNTGLARLSAEALSEALPKILKANIEKRMTKFGVRKDRAEVMGIAAVVFESVMKSLKLDGFLVPGVGLREGLILELADNHIVAKESLTRETALVAAARSFATRLGHDTNHGEQVRKLSRTLFDELQDLHELPLSAAAILEVAAMLHDVGEVVHRKQHHKTGEYLVLHGRIPGLDDTSRSMVAAIVRTHRRATPSAKKHKSYRELGKKNRSIVRKLSAILRIADAIDTDHRQRIAGLSAEVEDDRVIVHLLLDRAAGELAHLVRRKAEPFIKEFGVKLEFDVQVVSQQVRAATQNAS